jgi:hypothetical protein
MLKKSPKISVPTGPFPDFIGYDMELPRRRYPALTWPSPIGDSLLFPASPG